ncbi:hypothetical protein WOA01_13975 [Methylocystis sp. IM2]|uniref:hypothetical protein n=1 Tax=unclassified Methylocystis TaxID=2625913 RepID=UPI0030F86902
MLNWPPLCKTTSFGLIEVTVQESTRSPTWRQAPAGVSVEIRNAWAVVLCRMMAVTLSPLGASETAVMSVGAVALFAVGLRFLEKIGRDSDSTSADAGLGGSSSTAASVGGIQSGALASLSEPMGPSIA